MIKDITIGQYFPGNSILHKLDPRMKILLLMSFIITLFIASSPFSYLFLTLITIALMILSGVPLKMYIRGLKPLIIIICITGFLNMFYSTGEPILEFWIFRLTIEGILNAIFMITRILMLVIITSMLTYTTSPIVLTNGLERLLSPLKILKIPVHEFSMMMTIALRFIPILLEETDKIMNAQKSRGADFETGNILKRIKSLIPILIPLFVSAFRRATDLAIAMECRCYGGDSKYRTHLVQYKFAFRDYSSIFLMAFILTFVILLNRFTF